MQMASFLGWQVAERNILQWLSYHWDAFRQAPEAGGPRRGRNYVQLCQVCLASEIEASEHLFATTRLAPAFAILDW